MHTYEIYGIRMATNMSFIAPLQRVEASATLSFECAETSPAPGILSDANLLCWAPETGEDLRLYQHRGMYAVCFGEVLDYYLWHDRIVCHLHDPRHTPYAEIGLLGYVLSFWLEWQGRPALHASGAVVDGRVAAFLATNRGGKTSLAATLMQQGCPLLTDDILALDPDHEVLGHAAYPEMRMWPDLAGHFTGSTDGFRTVLPHIAKLRVPAEAIRPNSFRPEPCPIGCIYIPERIDDLEDVEIVPASPQERFQHLLQHTFAWIMVEAAGFEAQRFQVLARIARDVPVRHLRYPDGLEHLPRVAAAVREDMQALHATSLLKR